MAREAIMASISLSVVHEDWSRRWQGKPPWLAAVLHRDAYLRVSVLSPIPFRFSVCSFFLLARSAHMFGVSCCRDQVWCGRCGIMHSAIYLVQENVNGELSYGLVGDVDVVRDVCWIHRFQGSE